MMSRSVRLLLLLITGVAAGCGEVASRPTADADVSVSYTVTVTPGGDGAGTVTSSPGGIDCGTDCDEAFEEGTSVTLSATADAGSTFLGWTGGGCTGTGDCTFVVGVDVEVQASFGLSRSLVVTLAGAGTGGVTSSPAGIDCGTDCDEVYAEGTIVTLTATPTGGALFAGWSNACTGTGSTCVVTMDAAKMVTATFATTVITDVTSSTADGSYTSPSIVSIQVVFSGIVTVTGTPTLALNSGGVASYASGSGTNTLTFTYTVAAGHTTADLDYTGTDALALAGGTIQNAASADATLMLPEPGAAGSLGANKAIVIDAIGPVVTSVTSSTANGTYGTASAISIQVVFDESVTVTGTPRLTLNSGATVNYASGSGTTSLTFTYTVAAGQASADLDYTATTALGLNGGTIRDALTNNATLTLAAPGAAGSLGAAKAIVIDGIAPTLTFSGVAATAVRASGTLNWTSTETITVLSCTRDGTAQTCAAGATSLAFTSLGNGNHTIVVNYRDALNNTGSGTFAWQVMAPRYPTAMGGTYTTDSLDRQTNALRACEAHYGVGLCANDGCGTCNARGYHRAGTPNCNGSTYWNYLSTNQQMDCGWVSAAEILVSFDNVNWVQDATTGLGGTYNPLVGGTKQQNALRACEAVHGAGNCANDGCGSCNAKGYHRAGTPNCNGSVYWNYNDLTQNMTCNWSDPNEILVSYDGINWAQEPSNGFGGSYVSTTVEQTNALRACESVWGAGQCANDGCGSCNARGYHKSGTPNCNGSFYWNYLDESQAMSCGWVDPYEIIVSSDAYNWVQ